MLDGILATLGSTFDPHVLWEYRVVLLSGLAYNFYIFFLTIGFALGLGLIGAVLRLSSYVGLRGAGTAYAEVCRNTPEYIALIWIFYVPPLLLSMAMNENISFTPVLAAVIALSLTYSGYFTETFRAGILSVPKGHIEAARAIGMSRALVLRRVVLPQAIRHMLPEAMNQFVSLFKATALVSLIAVSGSALPGLDRGRAGIEGPAALHGRGARVLPAGVRLLVARAEVQRSLAREVEVGRPIPMESQWMRILWRNHEVMWDGFVITVQITAFGFAGAVVAGFVLCIVWLYVKPLRWPARALIEFFRGTPVYVQLLWVAYVWPGLFGWPNTSFAAGCTALALQSAGYLAETFRAGIEGINRGHIDAARAQGMSPFLIMRRIILPQAVHTMAPVHHEPVPGAR